ncbi:MAG: radical SAM/SPASM domain-containing protein [Kiritimatiellales bacterium]
MEKLKYYAKMAANRQGYVAAQLEVTSSCYQKCPMCTSWKDHASGSIKGMLTLEQAVDIHNQLKAMPFFEHLSLTGGDPQAWPHLDAFIAIWVHDGKPYELQITTALIRPPSEIWSELSTVRISFDGADADTYEAARGVRRQNPVQAIQWLEVLGIPYSVLTCLSSHNLENAQSHGRDLLWAIYGNLHANARHLRKWIVLVELGASVEVSEVLMQYYMRFAKEIELHFKELKKQPFEISLAGENLQERNEGIRQAAAKEVRCWAGILGCHIKPNGDVYPCCLVGGEAIATCTGFLLGNVFDIPLQSIQKAYAENPIYGYRSEVCREVCQFKQLRINQYGEEASRIRLAIP